MRITVVGDVLLDQDWMGTARRLSPDAPVPVVEVGSRRSRAGGAGLVAAMLRHDGHEVVLVTALADDAGADRIREDLEGVEIIAGDTLAPTPTKTRVRTSAHGICRIDEACETPPQPRTSPRMIAAVESSDAVVVSDYGRRLLEDPALREALARCASRARIVWDPHPRGAFPVPEVALLTPNLAEAAALTRVDRDAPDVATAARTLGERSASQAVLVTLGDRGALLHRTGHEPVEIGADAVPDADPCGAGDRLAASAAVALARGRTLTEAATQAVDDASAYLAAGGVQALGMRRLRSAAALNSENPNALAAAVRSAGGTVVAAGGCFDLLHAGHVRTLEAARRLGDCLIVCMNSDASVTRLKGPGRPIIGAEDRREMLAALACVDAVAVFDEDGPERLLQELRPDFWVKGGDYTAESLPEAPLLRTWGGRAVTFPYQLARSTTRLADAIERVG